MGRWKDQEVTKSGIEKFHVPPTMATSIRERRNFSICSKKTKKTNNWKVMRAREIDRVRQRSEHLNGQWKLDDLIQPHRTTAEQTQMTTRKKTTRSRRDYRNTLNMSITESDQNETFEFMSTNWHGSYSAILLFLVSIVSILGVISYFLVPKGRLCKRNEKKFTLCSLSSRRRDNLTLWQFHPL